MEKIPPSEEKYGYAEVNSATRLVLQNERC